MAITAEDDSFAGKRHGLPKLRQRRTSAEQPLETLLDSTAVSDDALLLDACQAKQIDRFRDEIRLCQDEATRYRLCLQTRDDLLSQHSSLQFLIAAFDQVMLAECAEYHAWRKNRKKPSSRQTNSREDDISIWERFVGVANEGMEIKYKCLSALTEVSRCWGLDKVQHYHWASKGEKYCKVLRTAARAVPEWAEAAIKLNRVMLGRHQRVGARLVKLVANPIEQRDLDTLKAWSYKQAYVKQNGRGQHSLLFEKLADTDLPQGFGFDRFGLMVGKEFAVASAENDTHSLVVLEAASEGDIVSEFISEFLAEQPADAEADIYDSPEVAALQEKPTQAERTLRPRTQSSYREPSGGNPISNKHATAISVAAPKVPKRCCPPEVPSTLLAALDNPLAFSADLVRVYSSNLNHLCHRHLQLFVKSVMAYDYQVGKSVGYQSNVPLLANPSDSSKTSPPRRRTASLPDINHPTPFFKKPRLGGLHTHWTGPRDMDRRPLHDQMADEAYCKQVLAGLQERLARNKSFLNTHGEEADKLVYNILQKAQQPQTDESCGEVDALFCTAGEATSQVESGSLDVPIFTESQQQFRWNGRDRPIEELFRRMEDFDRSVSVQVPSRSSSLSSFESQKLSQVRNRFLKKLETNDPWNILDLRSPLPPSILPTFLTGENCQLLPRVRDMVLTGNRAERAVASGEQWNEWRDVLEWALLSEGGHNTAPHIDSHGLATWITSQEGGFGFGWMSRPTVQERTDWMVNPQGYIGGQWRYVILRPGQTVFFNSGTIHFVFRVRGEQTLALGGHILQWSTIERWLQVVITQVQNPKITNEDMTRSVPTYVQVVAKLVAARVKSGRVDELGGDKAVTRFFASVKEFETIYQRKSRVPSRYAGNEVGI
ncbi:Putative JmjC domain-containing protein [Colletotrichum destructivum]|uniref:JmjC domain-containing protein n=1 Tax=Colletotrichum destructivum TaxID=34406 RepID=A0AAX4HZP8_9PEZI|nr:Putative JmjC domain-containing protein [Colletotrichum destructivum]